MKKCLKLVLMSFFIKIENKTEKWARQFCREFSGLRDSMKLFWKILCIIAFNDLTHKIMFFEVVSVVFDQIPKNYSSSCSAKNSLQNCNLLKKNNCFFRFY